MSGAGQQDQDSQKGKRVAPKLDQFPLLLMVSLSDFGASLGRYQIEACFQGSPVMAVSQAAPFVTRDTRTSPSA
jgi:hypothetical protein